MYLGYCDAVQTDEAEVLCDVIDRLRDQHGPSVERVLYGLQSQQRNQPVI